MKRILITSLLIGLSFKSYSQDRKNQFRLMDQGKHQLYVAFEIPEETGDVLNYYFQSDQHFYDLIKNNSIRIEPAFKWDDNHFEKLRSDAMKFSNSDSAVLILKGIYAIDTNLPNEELFILAGELEKFNFVRYAELATLTPIKPPSIDIPPTTPDFTAGQTYIQANPGVNMQDSWNKGIYGQGIRVRDVEYGMAVTHEELSASKFSNQFAINSVITADFIDHGTATAGVVAAHNGSYGVTGMQHAISEFKVFPEYSNFGYNRLVAVNTAISQSVAGDVIIYEMQTGGINFSDSNQTYVLAEYENTIWDATLAATSAGIHIVAAAGNGNQNLDSAPYASYMNRGDSGALIVGAGSPNTIHERLWFSTYGQRVNLQGWGSNVLTTGYGDYAKIGSDPNQSYTLFSGTSSATPIVASCVIALLSHAKTSGKILSPAEVRTILTTTGISQGGNTSQNIGPIPNMANAINNLDNYLLSTNKVDAIPMKIYPNPANNELFISFSNEFSNNQIAMFDTLGRQVYSISNYESDSPINISFLKSGMYILKMKSNNSEQSKKIMIK